MPVNSYTLEGEKLSYYSTEPGCSANRNETWTVGLIYCTNEMQGYTLFSPMASNTSYLIDHFGREVPQLDSLEITDLDYLHTYWTMVRYLELQILEIINLVNSTVEECRKS